MIDIKLEKQLPIVQINFEEVKASLISGSEKYRNLVVTEENLKDCKVMQKELSSTKKDLDTYRKDIKKEMLIPVTKFEGQCKELIGLVVDVETPIKESILIFDDKVREVKREIAQEHINKLTTDLLLNDKYGSQLIVSSEYTNVNMSVKKIKEDIEQRALLLQQEQQQEADNLQIIKNTIETVNKGIDAKILLEDFKTEIELNPAVNVIANINARAERIKANELKAIEDRKLKAEKEVLERIAKAEQEAAEKTRVEERNIRIAKEEAEYVEKMKLKVIEENEAIEKHKEELEKNKATEKLEQEAKLREMARNVDLEPTTEKLYFIDMRVENATIAEVKALSQFLKDNNYKYKAIDKGEM
jgi:hypothetical protein